MLSSSTVGTLKSTLGSSNFVDDVFGSNPEDFSPKGFQEYLKHKTAPAPLTSMEEHTAEEIERGVFSGGAGTSTAYAHGVAFPVTDECLAALDSLKNGEVNYVQVGVDVNSEKIVHFSTDTTTIEECKNKIPLNEPRFHFFNWDHDHEGEHFTSLVFCYSCVLSGAKGSISAPVKHRMLYSTSKSNVVTIAESRGLQIGAKIEINSVDEFTAQDLLPVLHPAKAEAKKTFNKPKPNAQRKLIT